MKLLVTGGMGFIGSNFVRLLRRERPDWRIVNLDLVTYAGNPDNLAGLDAPPSRYRFVRGDVANDPAVSGLFDAEGFDAVVHFAAESHVDRSIRSATPFLRTNVLGTQVLLDAARQASVDRFVLVSTDEVYGDLGPDGAPATESDPLRPSSPYSASKAAADHLAAAWHRTYRLDVVTTRCSNNYGPFQFPEKLIPLMIDRALHGGPLPVYARGENVRDWIHVSDHCTGVLAALERGRPGAVYNLGAGEERRNIDVVRAIAGITGVGDDRIEFVADRPGHDFRYALDASLARAELGWAPRVGFEDGLTRTVEWYAENDVWCERVRSGAYLEALNATTAG